jgi:hypothetical protein
VVAALALAACGRPDQEFINGTPDFSALSMEITGDTSEAASMQADQTGLMQTQSAVGSASEYLIGARNTVAALNGVIRAIMTQLVNLINSEDPTTPEADVRVYGPKDTEFATFKLTLKKIEAGKFGWKLEAKPLGGDDSLYVKVIAGWMVKGAQAHRGRGVIGIDLDAFTTVTGDPSWKGQGKLFSAFAHIGESKVLSYKLNAFSPNTDTWAPLTAAFVGYRQVTEGFTAIRIASWTNIDQTATTDPELILTRIRHKVGIGGRADIVALKGDLTVDTFYWGTGCWNAAEEEVVKILRYCTPTISLGDCTVVSAVGQITDCPGVAAQEPPAADENTDTMETGSPDGTVTPPTTMPSEDGI